MSGGAKITAERHPEDMAGEVMPPEGDAPPPIRHPRDLPRRKMGLLEQEHFLRSIADRCKMHSPAMRGTFAGEAILTLTRDDMAALVCIADTLNLFNFYDAADHVRRQAQRHAERKAAKR